MIRRFGYTSNRRQSVSAAKRFGYTSNRRQSVSAAKRFGGNVFRRFVCTLREYRVGCAVRRADRRIGGLPSTPIRRKARKQAKIADPPKSEKTGENRRNGEKIGTPGKCSKYPVLWCSTWNVNKLLSFNNLCKIVLNVRIIRLAYSDYKLLITSDLTF